MSEKLAEVFEQYDVEILGTRKGRGATILSTGSGVLILEPFRGNLTRLEQEYVLKQIFEKQGFVQMDQIIPNRDGCLFTCDRYRQPFVMKKYFEGNECDMHCPMDMVRSIKLLTRFHQHGKKAVKEFDQAWKEHQQKKEADRIREIKQALENGEEIERLARIYDIRENLLLEMIENADSAANAENTQKEELAKNLSEADKEIANVFVRHNRELKKIYRYISKVKQRNAFENLFLQVFKEYYEQGQYCVEQLTQSEAHAEGKGISGTGGADFLQIVGKRHFGICHGAFNQHNIILEECAEDESGMDLGGAIVHFERFNKGSQLNDLYQFTRKAMEKNHFDFELLRKLLGAYSEEISLLPEDYHYIYILFSYPEKFWKIANGYYNSNKAFLSPKYMEKLQNVIQQEEEKREMLGKFGALQASNN